ncbi:hypothetical protein [Luteimonas sp. R10]|uniref:hypothetical protein n=1 Tax=Luteimonas sp. R10 TaxID=3108176 RepID=UPI00309095AF|nr:hypothetical protein U3649_17985 [Luteimonas sp. R10]
MAEQVELVGEAGSEAVAMQEADVVFDGNAVAFPFASVQRYDRIRKTSKSNRNQRQVYYEVMGGDVSAVVEQVRQALVEAGYSEAWEREEYGGIRLKFTRQGTQPVAALVRDGESGPKLREENATASVYFTVIDSSVAH